MTEAQFREKILTHLQLIDTRLELVATRLEYLDNHINRIEHMLRVDFDKRIGGGTY